MTVVSDTGPIVALAKADHLSLLRILYGEVFIPPAVHRELLAKVGPEAERIDEGLAGFLRITPISESPEEVDRLTSSLGAGEQQAICLALQTGGLLVMDDRAGRKAAGRLGIATTGVVGVLLKAKQDGQLPMVGPVLEIIRDEGYWLSDTVVETAMRLAGESSSQA
jgi:predicted nucleic acid-binding protein